MSSEPEKAIEKEIRSYADQRRRMAEDAFELSEDTHEELLQEADRIFPQSILRPTSVPTTQPSIWPLLFRRVALFVPLAALLVITVQTWIDRRAPVGDAAKLAPPTDNQIETAPLPPLAEPAAGAEMELSANTAPVSVLDNVDLESIREPAMPGPKPTFTYTTERASSAPAEAPAPPTEPAAQPKMAVDSLSAGRKTAPSPSREIATKPASQKAEDKDVVVSTTAVAPMSAAAPRTFKAEAAKSVSPYQQSFLRKEFVETENLRANFNSPQINEALKSFSVTFANDQLILTDQTGKQFRGPIHLNYTPPAAPSAGSLLERIEKEVSTTTSKPSNTFLYFELAGPNNSAFTGNLVPDTALQPASISNLEQIRLQNYQVRGRAQIGTNDVFIHAVPSGN